MQYSISMGIGEIIQSVNKIAIAGFFFTGFFLLYEMYLLYKQRNTDAKTPKIPELQNIKTYSAVKKYAIQTEKKKTTFLKKPNHLAISILIILLVLFGIVFAVGSLSKNNHQEPSISLTLSPSPQPIVSEGIKIYDSNWRLLTKNQLRFLPAGNRIIIGIKMVANKDIAKARIRVNSNQWQVNHETKQFNSQQEVFYQDYEIATNDAQLKVEAQLFSVKEGWLGD